MAAVSLKCWSVSYGTHMIEVAAEDQYTAARIGLDYWRLGEGAILAGLRVNKIDRCIVVEVE